VARETGISIYRMLSGNMDGDQWEHIGNAINKCYDLPLFCVDAIGWKMDRIASACRRLVAEGVKILAIDHIQAIEPDDLRTSRAVQIDWIARNCKALARQLRVPVIALCQFNRDIEKRGKDARPILADLKESGGIEQYADVVWLLWRPDDTEETAKITEAEIIIPKQRMLQSGVVKCWFEGRKFRFLDRDDTHEDSKPKRQAKPTEEAPSGS
jgi:replicative DNA helicase